MKIGPAQEESQGFEIKTPTAEDEQEVSELNQEIEIEKQFGVGCEISKIQKAGKQIKVSFSNPSGKETERGNEKGQVKRTGPKEDLHPKGLRKRLREAVTLEKAMERLLTASNEERKLRAAVRRASSLETAFGILLEAENLQDEEQQP